MAWLDAVSQQPLKVIRVAENARIIAQVDRMIKRMENCDSPAAMCKYAAAVEKLRSLVKPEDMPPDDPQPKSGGVTIA